MLTSMSCGFLIAAVFFLCIGYPEPILAGAAVAFSAARMLYGYIGSEDDLDNVP
jgi:hypothetical protein